MAHKTFISYKHSEAQSTRDEILRALGEDATYYQGETSDSPSLKDYKTGTIKDRLKDMIYGASVTIVTISPNMRKSQWIPWEIQYSLYSVPRTGKISHPNGIVAVVQEIGGGYNWFIENKNGCNFYHDEEYVPDIIRLNRYNEKLKEHMNQVLHIYDKLWSSYISYITEDDFINKPHFYIENAFEKSRKLGDYKIYKLLT